MTPLVPFRSAVTDPGLLGSVLGGETWHAWRSILLAAMGEPLEPDEFETFRRLTGRSTPPQGRVDEFWGVIGRRGGKTKASPASRSTSRACATTVLNCHPASAVWCCVSRPISGSHESCWTIAPAFWSRRRYWGNSLPTGRPTRWN